MADDTTRIRLAGLAKDHSAAVDALVEAFNAATKDIVTKATARTIAFLQRQLSLTGDIVDQTPANARILRGIDLIFRDQMRKAGYDELVAAYVDKFGIQFRYFAELLDIVQPGAGVKFTAADRSWFSSLQLGAADSLMGIVDIAGELAKQRILFSVGGFAVADLAEALAERLGQTVPLAARLADTAITVFYRSIAETGFAKIERGLPANSIRYRYWGPDDKLTRPFCVHLVESAKTYTRAQINAMDNHQLPNVFLTCGGFRCRHSWLLAALETPAEPDTKVPNDSPARQAA